jgi:hypothetical protein
LPIGSILFVTAMIERVEGMRHQRSFSFSSSTVATYAIAMW